MGKGPPRNHMRHQIHNLREIASITRRLTIGLKDIIKNKKRAINQLIEKVKLLNQKREKSKLSHTKEKAKLKLLIKVSRKNSKDEVREVGMI